MMLVLTPVVLLLLTAETVRPRGAPLFGQACIARWSMVPFAASIAVAWPATRRDTCYHGRRDAVGCGPNPCRAVVHGVAIGIAVVIVASVAVTQVMMTHAHIGSCTHAH